MIPLCKNVYLQYEYNILREIYILYHIYVKY